jgi:hypothetical protein
MERKPVLFTIGFPFTVVMRAVESALKNVWEIVLNGPLGGVLWPSGIGRCAVSRGVRPLAEMDIHEMPELAPELATHAVESFAEIERDIGKSPSVGAGWPTIVSLQGSLGEMVNIETVFEPGFTARSVCGGLLVGY